MNEEKVNSNTPDIETERLVLRKFTMVDTESLFAILKDKEVNTFLPWFPFETITETEKHLQEYYLKSYTHPMGYRYAICLKSDNLPIGYIHVSTDESHDFGYGLRKEFWHRGIVTEACTATIEQLRKDGFSYMTATHDVNNPRSGAVMKKLGMTYRYSYEEQWQPKDILVTFRMYQLNFDGTNGGTYNKYWEKYPVHFIEENI